MPQVATLGTTDEALLDGDSIEYCDGAGEAMIVELHIRAAQQGFALEVLDQNSFVARVLARYNTESLRSEATYAKVTRIPGVSTQVGEATVKLVGDICRQTAFLGEMMVSALSLLRYPRRLRLRDTMLQIERAGVDALPIVLLIGFLMGVILAFMSATSFRQFGVEVYVADLIAIGLFRELGALITAIILAGRSGSAFAAELSSMKVNEEIDALITFGLPPALFLAVPRVIAATLVMPPLSLIAVFAGLLGGVLTLIPMGVPATVYWQHVINSTPIENVLFGLFKAGVFGLLVGMVGCAQGLHASRTPDAVGRAATAAVVGSLVLITIFDGIFAVLSYLVGI